MQSASFWKKLFFVLLTCALAVLFSFSPWCSSLDLGWYDFLFKLRGNQSAPEKIVVVAIDEDSFDELDLQWPWPRSLHAKLIDSLSKAGVKTIALDILFAEPSYEEEDQALADSIRRNGNVVLVNEVSRVEDPQNSVIIEKIIDPSPIMNLLKGEVSRGYSNMPLDTDGFVRNVVIKQSAEKSLSLVAAEKYQNHVQKDLPTELFVNFLGPNRTIKTISYYQALDPELFLPKDYLKNSLVFVGFSTLAEAELKSSRTDHFPIPYTSWGGGYMSGVEIHATAANSILNKNFIKPISERNIFIFTLLIGVLGGIVFFQLRPILGVLIYSSIVLLFSFVSYILFEEQGVFLSLPYLIIALSFCFFVSPFFHYWWVRQQRAYIKGAFETYLSPKLVDQVIRSRDKLELGGEEKEGTVLFLDLVGFTSISEKVSPKELIELINRNLGFLAEIILKYDGMIDKYMGDAIMAVWGVPLSDEKHAEKACLAALEIIESLDDMSAREKEISGADLSLRIGVSSGIILAGNVGGGKRLNYTVLGNAVNLASRLEGLNKDYGTKLIISEDTLAKLPDSFKVKSLASVRVKGQEREVQIYELKV